MQQEAEANAVTVSRCRQGTVDGQFTSVRLSLPDGRAGVRWGGLVFPLHPGDWIEVTDQAALPGDCRPWSPPQAGWRIAGDDASGEAYIFVDGSAAALDRALAAIRACGLQPVRSGPNMSGTPGDWFVRVHGWTGAAAQALSAALGAPAVPTAGEPASLRERLLRDRFEQLASERDALRRELADTRAQLQTAVADSGDAMQGELEALASRLLAAEAERAEADATQGLRPQRTPAPSLERELSAVFEALLPRIELLRRSLTFACIELTDRGGLWRGLAQLDRDTRGTPPSWKAVKGPDGWIERHFSNGQDNQGRLYARHVSGHWQVLVSHKQEQPSDMRWLQQQR